MAQELIFTIIQDGKVKIEANGFVGGACKAATEAFSEALGGETLSTEDKPEMYQSHLPGTVVNRNG